MGTILTGAASAEHSSDNLFPDSGTLRRLIHESGNAVILTDNNVAEHCLDLFYQWIPEASALKVIKVEAGESSKTFKILELVLEFLTDCLFDRHSLLICLGGGMVTDLGGFAASVYKRGIPCAYVPTSLMAMVDAAWGGKTAIDFENKKNIIGTFNFQIPVFLNTIFLNTLPERRIREALAEMLKHELLFSQTELKSAQAISQNSKIDEEIIRNHVQMKLSIVDSDPYEKNQRKFLNLGHTLGHALEGYGLSVQADTYHGECVAAGIIFSLLLSVEKCNFPSELALKHCEYISKNCLLANVVLPEWEKLKSFLIHDKKNLNKIVSWVLLDQNLLPVFNSDVEESLCRQIYSSEQFRGFLR
jgi:3-dehydroquinate synthase